MIGNCHLILTTSSFIVATGAISSAVTTLILVDASAVGAFIFRAWLMSEKFISLSFSQQWMFSYRTRCDRFNWCWTIIFVAVVSTIRCSIAAFLRLDTFSLAEEFIVLTMACCKSMIDNKKCYDTKSLQSFSKQKLLTKSSNYVKCPS